MDVSFVLPCLNEAKTIAWCVSRAHEALDALREGHALTGEVIVADNGSTDGSQDLARAAGARVIDVAARGYGAALRGGFEVARGRNLVMGDSDRSYDFLEAVSMVLELQAGADLCMGSRFRGEIKPRAMPWKNRHIGNPILSGILRMLFRTTVSDAHCGLRAITADAYERLNLSSTGMEFASEMVLKSVLKGYRVAEVPVTLWPDGRGRPPHLNPWRDGLRHLIYMLLLSPSWLFLLPAALMFSFGLVVLAILLMAGDAEMARLGSLGIGDHWAVAASTAMIMAVQTTAIGLFALVYNWREGLRSPGRIAAAFLRWSRLQYWLLGGALLVAAGLVWAGSIALDWINSDFGALDEMRGLIAAATLIVIGSQIFFSGLLISIFSGYRARHAVLI
ncbi:glycosyltransferase family 2 protein [Actibacterium sp. MT2.3-13A]|uniref:glycosyltransferase family 2 protein n=1 Tax=Actibacterium sp. MT2.3-13A TaxID=2828332 RepID=UPI001BA671A9|nr:glycosyltransferase family 2 protein [Actibacterium sp. MT2.3-13A]